ncbi:hypothetical protein K440DRAFT_647682 [Wilcoxina mikolae CBS 423.85]|nr:hypothetical protein K440DRAFT_647682 [Wilcoxina mikolae CBS 423.85]
MTLHSPSFDKTFAPDAITAISIALEESWPRLIRSWIHVPIGTVLAMLALWGIDSVIRLTGISFPASVAGMLLLFAGLLGLEAVLGERRVKGLVRVIDVPASFALKYINLFFVPSFVLLPLSPSIGAAEVGKIVAVFCGFPGLRCYYYVLMVVVVGFVVVLAATVYVVRALQLVLPKSKRVNTDDGDLQESIPLTHTPGPSQTPSLSTPSSMLSLLPPPAPALETQRLRGAGPVCTSLPERITGPRHISRPSSPPSSLLGTITPPPSPPPLSRAHELAAKFTLHLDTFTYALLFLISLPVLHTTSYSMPAHLTLTTLAFIGATSLPKKSQQILHPVLSCAAITILGVYTLSLTQHTPFKSALKSYRVGTKYLDLFRGTPTLHPPGAGDIFSSLLDVSIVALALPMYTHRLTLLHHLPLILIPSLLLAAASLSLYPLLCTAIGISPPRAIAFSARSITLALATPAVASLGGDTQFLAVICVTTGICGVLVGPRVLRWLKVGEGEYVVRGVALGGNGSAVATAWLLGRGEPRAAAMSSLAMVGFGVAVVVASAVGPVRDGVVRLVGVGG